MTSAAGQSLSIASVGRSALLLTGGAAAVQLLGIVRELFLAAQIGASVHLDALLIAMVLPISLPSMLTSGATTALVPAYLQARQTDGILEARRMAGTILVWAGIGGVTIWLLLAAFASVLVAITGPGLDALGKAEAVEFLQLLAPIAFLTAISAVLYAVFQAEQRFIAMSAATFVGSATTLAIMLLLWEPLGLRALAVGSLIGPIVVVTILLADAFRASLMPVPALRPGGRLNQFVRHAAPLTVGAAVLQLNVVADRAVASLLGPGSVSVLRYADVLVRIPVGAIGPAWGSAIYPSLVRSTLEGAADTLALDTQRSIRFATAIIVPVAMLTAAVAPLAVGLAFGRGAFTPDALAATAGAVAAFAPLILILMISPVLTGAHNARRRGRVLLIGASINVVLNFILDVALGLSLGIVGVALSSSITSALVLVFFGWRLATSERAFTIGPIARTLGLAVLASTPMTVAGGLLCWGGHTPSEVVPAAMLVVGIGLLGAVGYLVAANWLGMEEPGTLIRQVLRRRSPERPV